MLYYGVLLNVIASGVFAWITGNWHASWTGTLSVTSKDGDRKIIPIHPIVDEETDPPDLRDPCDECMDSCENCCPGALSSDKPEEKT